MRGHNGLCSTQVVMRGMQACKQWNATAHQLIDELPDPDDPQ